MKRFLLGLALWTGTGVAIAQDREFTIALLPDTQHYSDSEAHSAQFVAQTEWIAAHRLTQRIVFVTQAGDLVNHGGQLEQWLRADAAMDVLDGDLQTTDGLVPYSAVCGNHDYTKPGDKRSGAALFLEYFGPRRYSGRSWFLGASPSELNMVQVFEVDGERFLHVGLEWEPDDDVLAWVQREVLDRYPTLPTLITTHVHLTRGVPGARSTAGGTPDSAGDNSAESLFRKLIEPNPQVFMVLSGHHTGAAHNEQLTATGQRVLEVMADYQSDPNGGNGFFQLLRFKPRSNEVEVRAFSPTYQGEGPDRSQESDSNYTLLFDLQSRRSFLEAHRVLHFRQGQSMGGVIYEGAVDTYIGNSSAAGGTQPDASNGDAGNLLIAPDGGSEQALLKFTGIVGAGAQQIPPGAKVERAILTLTTEGVHSNSPSGGTLHLMRVPWNADSTYTSLGAGVDLLTEANPRIAVDTRGKVHGKGTRSFDVTTNVQNWVNGRLPNEGWLLNPNSSGVGGEIARWSLRSSDWVSLAERPMLTVILKP